MDCLLCFKAKLENSTLNPDNKELCCPRNACPGRFRRCGMEEDCLLLPVLQEKAAAAKKPIPSQPLALMGESGEGILGIGKRSRMLEDGCRKCNMCKNAAKRAAYARARAPSGASGGKGPETAAAEDTDEDGISEPEPEPEQQSCLGHLLKDGCAADEERDGLCRECHKEYHKKQFEPATTFLRWQLELAILGTRPSFTGDIFGCIPGYPPVDKKPHAKLMEGMNASKDHPLLSDATVVWNCFGVGGDGEGEGVSGGRELTKGVKRVHAAMQAMYEQAKEVSKLTKYAAPDHWFGLGEITKRKDGTQRPKNKYYTCYPPDIDSFAPQYERINSSVDDQSNALAVLLRGAALIPTTSYRTTDKRGCFYLCTLAFERVPVRLPYRLDRTVKFELGYDRLFPLLREAFCSPERYIMQDALLPALSQSNGLPEHEKFAKYDIGLVRFGTTDVPFEKVVLAKEDLRELRIVCRPEDGIAFVHSPDGHTQSLHSGYGVPSAKRAKNK